MNITVRTGGVLNNTLTREQFMNIVTQIFGEGKTVDQYIKLYNDAPRAQQAMITVHHEVPADIAEAGAQAEDELESELEDHQLEIDEIVTAVGDQDPTAFMDAALENINDAVDDEHQVDSIEFAEES